MAINYPTSLDTLSNPAASDTLDNVTTPHATQHANANDILEALEAKLGIGASTPTLGDTLQGTAAGATAYGRMQLVNQLVNGGFEFWQRGTSFATMATGSYGPDRWVWTKGGTSALNMDQESTIIDTASRYALKLTYTHNAASTVQQKLEDAYQLRGKTLTVSMKVRANAANAVRLRIDDSAGNGTAGSYHTGGGTFETLTATKAINSGATTVTVTIELNATVTAYLDNAMLVIGSVAVDYVPLHPADEFARCQRYYEVQGLLANGPLDFRFYANTTDLHSFGIHCISKLATPTVTKNGTWTVTNCGQPLIGGGSVVNGYRLGAVPTGAGYCLFFPTNATCSVTLEANP